MKKTIFLGLNEINFEYIDRYIEMGELPHFKTLFSKYGYSSTTSEDKYELLEPWIQWVTINTGMTYKEHGIFRLGDIVERKEIPQLYEKIESMGYSVGAVSPFNTDNRLSKPLFFVPDPWTKTKSSGSEILKNLSAAVSQAVNDNASSRITFSSALAIVLGILRYTTVDGYLYYFKKFLQIKKKGTKAMILDRLLSDVFFAEWKKDRPDFSHLFLNSGAHLQHHYMFNAKVYSGDFNNPDWYCPKDEDPLLGILKLYDSIVGKLLKLPVRLVVATGLHQKPHKHLTYYWRLKFHTEFLEMLGIQKITSVIPRMSRDFLVEFESNELAKKAEETLLGCKSSVDNKPVFAVDNRGKSLFVELVYPNDITDQFDITGEHPVKNFKKYIAFVAIKNGEHDPIGYVVDSEKMIVEKQFPLTKLHDYLIEGFVN